jgi:hypothetical protein
MVRNRSDGSQLNSLLDRSMAITDAQQKHGGKTGGWVGSETFP